MELGKLGRYTLIEELGAGAFGTVYRARDEKLNRTVALKVLKPGYMQDPATLARFRHEAQSAANLQHPNIVTVFDFDTWEGFVYLVMQYIEGPSLENLILAERQLHWSHALRILLNVIEGLQYAHRHGYVHRDIKPANILIGEDDRAYLVDFGLVKAAEVSGLTSTHALMGTPFYIPPEIWEGRPATPASDVYSLACVYYEMITGDRLFQADTLAGMLKIHLMDPPGFPEKWPAGVPDGIAAVLGEALSKSPEERPAAAEFGAKLQEMPGARHEPAATTIHPPAPVHRSPEQRPVPVSSAVFEPAMIRIPAGRFTMGSGEEHHSVSLPEYHVGKYPVTNQEYQIFVEATGHQAPRYWTARKPVEDQLNHPVVDVSWHDALAYCRWLSEETGVPYTLPSEAEWEKAARGTADVRRYPWGNEYDPAKCNTDESGFGNTTSIGQFSPQGDSPYGCVDMSGNAWEWTRSRWGQSLRDPDFAYPYYPDDGRENLEAEDRRVLRGGSFGRGKIQAQVFIRGHYAPDLRNYNNGFRLAILGR